MITMMLGMDVYFGDYVVDVRTSDVIDVESTRTYPGLGWREVTGTSVRTGKLARTMITSRHPVPVLLAHDALDFATDAWEAQSDVDRREWFQADAVSID